MEPDAAKKTKVIMKKRNLQLIFDRNTIHSESFGLNWTMKKKWTGSMTSPLRTVRLNIGGIGQDNGVEGGETKKWFTEKGTFAPIYFLINDLCFKAALFRVSRKFAASHNFPPCWEIVADRPRGIVLTPAEHLRIFLWEVSERPLLRDVGKMHLKYDGLSPTVIGHDLNPAGAWI